MRKTIVLDTNVLLENPNILTGIPKNDIVVPYKVIEELDKHKSSQGLKGLNARTCSRTLSTLIEKSGNDSLKTGIKLSKDSNLIVKSHKDYDLDSIIEENNADDCILKVALGLKKDGLQVTLMSNDVLLRIRANTFGLETQSYDSNQDLQSINDLYTGYKIIPVDDSVVEMYYQNKAKEKYFPLNAKKLTKEKLMPNEYLILTNDKVDPKKKPYLLLRYTGVKGNELEYVNSDRKIGKLKALNIEQAIAFDMLMNKDIQLVSLTGIAGCGKTLAAIAAGLEQVMDMKLYQNIIVLRPMHAVGKEIGYLPGSKEEKLEPWIAPIKDNLKFLMSDEKDNGRKTKAADHSVSYLFDTGVIEVEALTYIRGRSLNNTFIIVDECFPGTQGVLSENGKIKIQTLFNKFQNKEKLPLLKTYNETTKQFEFKKIKNIWSNGEKELIEIIASNRKICCTPNHKILTKKGWKRADSLVSGDLLLTDDHKSHQMLFDPTKDQIQMIIGSYLGDGNISNHGLNRYRLRIIHGNNQLEYNNWKCNFFGSKLEYIKENGFSKKPASRFGTLMFGMNKHFPKTKTQCPSWILENINEKGLAIWFQDDGTVNKTYNSARISVCSFSDDTNENIVKILKNKFGLECKFVKYVKKTNGEYYGYLNINKENYYKLSSLIAKYCHKNLEYKIHPEHKNMVGTGDWNSDYNNHGLTVVKTIKNINKVKEVFDLEMEDNHNFIICSQSGRVDAPKNGVIVHNCQNVSAHEMKTILTRAGKDTKIVAVGDINQIDRTDIDSVSNGLSVVVEKFKTYSISSHCSLVEGVRSELSELAAKIL